MRSISDYYFALLVRIWRLYIPVFLRRRNVEVGDGAQFLGVPLVSVASGAAIRVGKRVVLTSHSRFTALGVARPCILRATRPGALIEIGSDTGASGLTICAAKAVRIGRGCLIGADVLISDSDFHPIESKERRYVSSPELIPAEEVRVGDNVFIGARVIILKGVSIGDNSVIAAGSVVSSDVPANMVYGGVPAKKIRELFEQ